MSYLKVTRYLGLSPKVSNLRSRSCALLWPVCWIVAVQLGQSRHHVTWLGILWWIEIKINVNAGILCGFLFHIICPIEAIQSGRVPGTSEGWFPFGNAGRSVAPVLEIQVKSCCLRPQAFLGQKDLRISHLLCPYYIYIYICVCVNIYIYTFFYPSYLWAYTTRSRIPSKGLLLQLTAALQPQLMKIFGRRVLRRKSGKMTQCRTDKC